MKVVPKANPSAPQSPTAAPRIIKMTTQAPRHSPETQAAPPPPAVAPSSEGLALPVNTETQATEATQALSPQYTALAKRERALRKLQEEIKQKEAEFSTRSGNNISLEDLKKDPFGALNRAGVTYEQLTQLPSTESPQDPMQAKIEALEAKLQAFDKRNEERSSEDYAQAVKVIEGDAALLVNSDPAFETIKATGNVKEVVRLIEKIYEDEGIIMDVHEAASLVEQKLAESVIKQYETFSQLTKVKAKLSPPAEAAPQQSEQPEAGKTLTNAMGAARQLSVRERAILAFNNRLKS